MGDDLTSAVARLAARHGLTDVAAIGAGVESQVFSAVSGMVRRVDELAALAAS